MPWNSASLVSSLDRESLWCPFFSSPQVFLASGTSEGLRNLERTLRVSRRTVTMARGLRNSERTLRVSKRMVENS